ncbi:unnamed protein product [Blepharisma stoltei]|uniref:Uncharacterized protein n=1 Tax=Blepharisma stoltei TaxID=1481888 RepID=A0AAU9J4M4_9CILI|nr:unnamed protein product [Blepharisma stoltei]
MRALKAIFFGTKRKDKFIYIRALQRVKKDVLSPEDQDHVNAYQLASVCIRFVAAPISLAAAYYIPIPDFLYPIPTRICTFLLCYRSISIPVILPSLDCLKQIALKYDLINRPDLLTPPVHQIYEVDQELDRGKEKNDETFKEYQKRIKETEIRLREAYELDKRYKKSVSNESFEEYRDQKLS